MNLVAWHPLTRLARRVLPCLSGLCLLSPGAAAGGVQWNIVTPSTTGIPGEELQVMTFDPQGNLWVAGRSPFWGDSGVARLPAAQVPFQPLPNGGFDTGAWEVWSNAHYAVPSAYIDDIVFGANGVVWFASEGGLTRFEPDAADPGATFFTFNAANSPLLLDGVGSLDMDSSGRLWMVNGTVQDSPAVFSFDPATSQWQQFDMGEELPWPSNFRLVNQVHVGPSGHVWVTHGALSGLAEYDGQTWTLHAGGAQFDRPLEDLQGNVWLTTANSGLWKWNGASFQNWPTLGNTMTIAGLGMDPDGLVYVSTWYGATFRMVGGTTPVFFVDADGLPYHVEPRPDGDVWIGNYGGGISGTARHYTADGTLLERINTWNSGFPEYFVNDIFTDTAGNLWFATGEAGLSRMLGSDGSPGAPTHWRNFGDHNAGSEPYPWAGNEPMSSIYDTGEGVIWMGGNGIGRWDVASGAFTGFWNWENSTLGTDQINDFDRDVNGSLWSGTDGSGAFRFNGVGWEHHAFSNPYSYSQERVLSMATDHAGLMWVGAEYGLHTFDGTTWTALHFNGSLPFAAGSVLDIEVGPDGDVWVCTGAGLARWNGTQWTVYTTANSGLLANEVKSVSIRADGLVAVASYTFTPSSFGGVNTFDGTTWTGYTTSNSPLTHFQVEAVQFDADGDLWASAMSEGVVEIELGDTGVTEFCADSVAASCPCGNPGQPGHGCQNSVATGGARLTAVGSTHPDTLLLTSSGELPTALSIFLQGDANIAAGVRFGDGVRCVGGHLKRLYVKNASGGIVSAPQGGDPSITSRSAMLGDTIVAGSTRYYQVYYRDRNLDFCPNPPGNTFNASSGVSVRW